MRENGDAALVPGLVGVLMDQLVKYGRDGERAEQQDKRGEQGRAKTQRAALFVSNVPLQPHGSLIIATEQVVNGNRVLHK